MDAIAVADIHRRINLKPDKLVARVFLATDQSLAPDEIIHLRFQRHRKPDPGFKRVGLVGEIIARKDQPRLNPHHIQRCQPHRPQPQIRPVFPNRIPNRSAVLGVTEHLKPQLAGIPCARHHHRCALRPAQTAHREAEPPKFGNCRLMWGRPDHPLHNFARVRPLYREVVQLIGGTSHHHFQPKFFCLLAQPDARVIIATNPAELILAKPEQSAVVDHPAVFVAHRRINHLTHRQLLHIPRQAIVQQSFGIRPRHLKLPQRRQIQHHGFLAAGPVFFDGPVRGIGLRQPIALIFHQIAGFFHDARMEGGLFGHHRLRCRGGAVGDGPLEGFGTVIGAHMDVGQIPAIRGRRVVWAGGIDANQIGQRAQQNVIAGARPRLVRDQHAMRVDSGVEEQVHRHPAGAGGNAMRGEHRVEIVRAVHMAGIADLVIVFRRTGHRERIMAAHGVLNDFNQWQPVLIIVFRMQAGHRIGMAHQGARGGHVQRML